MSRYNTQCEVNSATELKLHAQTLQKVLGDVAKLDHHCRKRNQEITGPRPRPRSPLSPPESKPC